MSKHSSGFKNIALLLQFNVDILGSMRQFCLHCPAYRGATVQDSVRDVRNSEVYITTVSLENLYISRSSLILFNVKKAYSM